MPCSGRTLSFILIIIWGVIDTSADAQKLLSYRCEVDKLNWHTATVISAFQTTAEDKPITIFLRTDDIEQLTALQVKDESGHSLVKTIVSTASGLEVHAYSSGSHLWNITYTVTTERFPLYKIPLPIPSVSPVPGSHVVHLLLSIPPTEELYGDLFPDMMRKHSNQLTAGLSGVPAFLIFHSRSVGSASLRDQIFSTTAIADLSMLLLLGGGTFLVFMRTKLSRKV